MPWIKRCSFGCWYETGVLGAERIFYERYYRDKYFWETGVVDYILLLAPLSTLSVPISEVDVMLNFHNSDICHYYSGVGRS